jgi:hypothetical protein
MDGSRFQWKRHDSSITKRAFAARVGFAEAVATAHDTAAMILSPLAFFDLLERHASDWLPPIPAGAAWDFARSINLLEKRAELRLLLQAPGAPAKLVATVRAREQERIALQGTVLFPGEAAETQWILSARPEEDLVTRAIALARGWQEKVAAAVG